MNTKFTSIMSAILVGGASLIFFAPDVQAWDAKYSTYYHKDLSRAGTCSEASTAFCAPGWKSPNKTGTLDLTQYMTWMYTMTINTMDPTVKLVLAEGDDPDEVDTVASLVEIWAEEAHAEAGSTPGETPFVTADPNLQSSFEAKLRGILHDDIKGSMAGPYYQSTFAWYESEIAFERSHGGSDSDFAKAFQVNKADWINEYLSERAYEIAFAADIASLKAKRDKFITAKLAANEIEPVAIAMFENENAEALAVEAKRRSDWVEANKDKVPEAVRAEFSDRAEAAYSARLAVIQEYPFVNPELLPKMKAQKAKFKASTKDIVVNYLMENNDDSTLNIAIDISRGFQEMKVEEAKVDSPIKEDSTLAHEAYVIVPAPAWAAAAALQFRNGVTINKENPGQLPIGVSQTYAFPKDPFFQYRREVATSRTAVWGPYTWLNESIKNSPIKSFVDTFNDTYAIVLRGNKEDGYDILFQYIGANCPHESTDPMKETVQIRDCKTPTHSNLTIGIIRPIDSNRSLLKMSSRFVGQEYAGINFKYSEVGFNWYEFYIGWARFNQEAKEIAETGMIKDRADENFFGDPMKTIPLSDLF